jgi:HPt (histidine-containing phosphotransfer) domain-containing protein
MSDNDVKSNEERLAEILAAIDQSVRDWMTELQIVADEFAAARSVEEGMVELKKLRELAHNIGGSAGSLGFPGVSDTALPLELECIASIENENGPSAEQQKKIANLVHTVMKAMPEVTDS